MCRSPDNSCAVCVQCSMKLRFEEKILYSQDPIFNCFPLKQNFNTKRALLEEICIHTTESTQQNPFNNNNNKYDENKLYLHFKYSKFRKLNHFQNPFRNKIAFLQFMAK